MENNNLDLLGQFARLQWLLHRYHHQNHRYHGPMGDPHRGQGRVLALLKLKPEISQKDLSNILDMRSQSLGELLAKLERNGYITRTPSQTDGRAMDIHLTEAGKKASEQNEQQLDTEGLFECLNEEEQATLSNYLNRVISTLEQQLADNESLPDLQDRLRAFAPYFHMRGGHSHFHGRHFCQRSDMNGHPPFDDRSQHSDEESKPDDTSTKS